MQPTDPDEQEGVTSSAHSGSKPHHLIWRDVNMDHALLRDRSDLEFQPELNAIKASLDVWRPGLRAVLDANDVTSRKVLQPSGQPSPKGRLTCLHEITATFGEYVGHSLTAQMPFKTWTKASGAQETSWMVL